MRSEKPRGINQEAVAAGETAVLAELRAIGLSLAVSTGVLRPVQAREVRGLAKRLVGSTDLLGQVFRWGRGEDYLVNDIAQGTTPSGGQAMMAYACCVKRRVASAGRCPNTTRPLTSGRCGTESRGNG